MNDAVRERISQTMDKVCEAQAIVDEVIADEANYLRALVVNEPTLQTLEGRWKTSKLAVDELMQVRDELQRAFDTLSRAKR